MTKIALTILVLGGLGYLTLCAFLYLRQRSLIYYPQPASRAVPAESVNLESQGQRLRIWRDGGAHDQALLYFGGNAEDVSINLPEFRDLFPGHTRYLMNYRGYGGSSGSPAEAALQADALALYDLVARDHGRIVVMGRSLGSGVAVRLAAERAVAGLILVTPYSSMVALGRHYYPLLPVALLLRDRFEAVGAAPRLTIPVLALLAGADEIIPARISEDLVEAFRPGLVTRVVIDGAGHNTIDHHPDYGRHIRDFLERLKAGARR